MDKKEGIENRRILILKVIKNLTDAKDHKNFKLNLQECNDILLQNDNYINEIHQNLDDAEEVDQRQRYVNSLLKENLASDEKEAEKELEELLAEDNFPQTNKKKLLSNTELPEQQ